jgi:FtsH-binding integral membrane protein
MPQGSSLKPVLLTLFTLGGFVYGIVIIAILHNFKVIEFSIPADWVYYLSTLVCAASIILISKNRKQMLALFFCAVSCICSILFLTKFSQVQFAFTFAATGFVALTVALLSGQREGEIGEPGKNDLRKKLLQANSPMPGTGNSAAEEAAMKAFHSR